VEVPTRAALVTVAVAATIAVAPMRAQSARTRVGEEPVGVSDHVWALMGWPNIGIVVGTRATLVVDTGLGPSNGAAVARAVARLSGATTLYLTTTHFHPEHASGEPGFPPGTILIRDAVQQREMNERGVEFLDRFRKQSAEYAQLLGGVTTLRTPD